MASHPVFVAKEDKLLVLQSCFMNNKLEVEEKPSKCPSLTQNSSASGRRNGLGHKECCCLFRIKSLFNSLWLSNIIWHDRSGSTLTQVMACYHTASNHCLNLCWLIINGDLWRSPKTDVAESIQDLICKIILKNYFHISQGPMSPVNDDTDFNNKSGNK